MARTSSGEGFDLDLSMLLIVVFSWGAATSLGLIGDNVLPFVDAGATIWEVGNATFTIGRIVSIATLLFVFFYRDAPLSDTNGIDLWIVYATIGLVIAPPLFPALESTIASQPAALVAFTVQSTGFLLVDWVN